MKNVILAALFIATFAVAASGGGAAHAQQNACPTNPSPVDATDPSIIVTAPAANASATSPLHVEGQARVFEATVSLKLIRSGGGEIDMTTQAAEGGVLSPFSADISFSVSAADSACLWVYEVSARDGSPTNVVQIPLTLNPSAGLPSTGTGVASASTHLAWLMGALAIAGAGLTGVAVVARRVR